MLKAMVAGQAVETHNDMYCSQYDYYQDYYPQQPELCPAHTQLCTVHGEYGKKCSHVSNPGTFLLLDSLVVKPEDVSSKFHSLLTQNLVVEKGFQRSEYQHDPEPFPSRCFLPFFRWWRHTCIVQRLANTSRNFVGLHYGHSTWSVSISTRPVAGYLKQLCILLSVSNCLLFQVHSFYGKASPRSKRLHDCYTREVSPEQKSGSAPFGSEQCVVFFSQISFRKPMSKTMVPNSAGH